jgi:hypothetical protein
VPTSGAAGGVESDNDDVGAGVGVVSDWVSIIHLK